MILPVISFESKTVEEFLEFWSAFYLDKNEKKYVNNIGKPLTSEKIMELYYWKNGGKLSIRKRAWSAPATT